MRSADSISGLDPMYPSIEVVGLCEVAIQDTRLCCARYESKKKEDVPAGTRRVQNQKLVFDPARGNAAEE